MGLDPSELFPEIPNLYEFPSVHAAMVYDEQRVRAYQAAIRATVKAGDVVADVGTGTGLLAFMCIQAGASRVHAIERSSAIEYARDLAAANGFADRITFYDTDSRDAVVPEKVDVIVSELIGHVAFEEGMVETLSDARDRFLKDTGTIIPRTVTLLAAPVCEREVYAGAIDVWKPVSGIDYSSMRRRATQVSYITEIHERDLVAGFAAILRINLSENTQPTLATEQTFTVHRSGSVNGVALWFDAYLTEHVTLSSGPWSKTHWKQCFAPIPDSIQVFPGHELDVSFNMHLRSRRNDRFSFNVSVRKRRHSSASEEEKASSHDHV